MVGDAHPTRCSANKKSPLTRMCHDLGVGVGIGIGIGIEKKAMRRSTDASIGIFLHTVWGNFVTIKTRCTLSPDQRCLNLLNIIVIIMAKKSRGRKLFSSTVFANVI
jgi:hypothetical protein